MIIRMVALTHRSAKILESIVNARLCHVETLRLTVFEFGQLVAAGGESDFLVSASFAFL